MGTPTGFKSVILKAVPGKEVAAHHQAMMAGVTIEAGMHIPSMTAVANKEEGKARVGLRRDWQPLPPAGT